MTQQGAKTALEKIAVGLESHEEHPAMQSAIGDFFLTAAKFREVVQMLKDNGLDYDTILEKAGLVIQFILKYGPVVAEIVTKILEAIKGI